MSRKFQKCGCLLFYNFLNPSYCCPKSGQISRILLAKLRCHKKKTRLHFFVSRLHMNRTWVSHGTFEVLFMAEVKTKNCSRVSFLTPHNFEDKLKISDSVDFEQP